MKVSKKETSSYLKDTLEFYEGFPEFNMEEIIKKHSKFTQEDDISGDGGLEVNPYVFDSHIAAQFAILTYCPDSPYQVVQELRERKEWIASVVDVPKEQVKRVVMNENPMIGDMATRILREVSDFDYELLISAKEAIETLLEVVRKPINTYLQDDKERNAVKAKRECFDDAKYLMAEVRTMLSVIKEDNPDVASHINESVFKGGFAERMAGMKKGKS